MQKALILAPIGLLALITGGAMVVVIGAIIFASSMMGINKPEETTDLTGTGTGVTSYNVNVSKLGQNEIPQEYVQYYKAAGEKYSVPWTLISAIHRVETNFSSDLNTSSTGAIGHTQFQKATWLGWSYPGRNRLGDLNVSDDILMNPSMISKYNGFGQDCDGDGKANPFSIADAMCSTANYLSKNGGSKGDWRGAVYAYNHAGWYVNRVFKYYNSYTSNVKTVSVGASSTVSGNVKGIDKAIAVGSELIGKSPYNFGGGRTQRDIDRRSFDCSSFIRWAFSEAGINLGKVDTTTTDTLVRLGKPVQPSEIRKGDLIFFDTYKKNGHVAVALDSNGNFLHDGSTHGVWKSNLSESYYKRVFKGVVRRVVE
ncbi:bifunctional lytic transglycosylase/C40 family peptidase [Priestia aryabhattai]|uniref:C40 family peptidase n=1 Tax=Priestia aryabhattai TaxID=412384 RepID=UPI003D2DACA5